MTSAVGSVVIAAAQSVAKVYVIGAAGYAAVKFPRKAPLLPAGSVSVYARFGFNVLTIPLIFSTIASSVTIDSIGDYWFVLVGAVGVLAISFSTATLLGYLIPSISNNQSHQSSDFNALRIAATFPNIVALPILIFPSLCEYEVVYEGYATSTSTSTTPGGTSAVEMGGEEEIMDRAELYRQCVARSNTMIFCYFFGWSLLFWSCGHPALMNAAAKNNSSNAETNESTSSNTKKKEEDKHQSSTTTLTTNQLSSHHDLSDEEERGSIRPEENDIEQSASTYNRGNEESARGGGAAGVIRTLSNIKRAILQVFTSPPFVAMVLAFIIGCITPIRDLFFSQGGPLRFIGAAAEALGQASSPMSTMVVAASLASSRQQRRQPEQEEEEAVAAEAAEGVVEGEREEGEQGDPSMLENNLLEEISDNDHNDMTETESPSSPPEIASSQQNRRRDHQEQLQESPIMSDPNYGPLYLRRRSSASALLRTSLRHMSSVRGLVGGGGGGGEQSNRGSTTSPEQRRLLLWFTLSKLILSPALVVLTIVGLDCSGVLVSAGVPDLAKLVLIVNSSVPGALIVVVLLKSNPQLHETAAVVAKVYFPTYLLSIVTIAAWTAIGLIVTLPDEEGNSFCARY